MQTQPGRFNNLFLTILGLGMLVFAAAMNHYHPRNAGVATTTHGSITTLALDTRQFAAPVTSQISTHAGGPVNISGPAQPSVTSQPSNSLPNGQPDKVTVTEAVNHVITTDSRCQSLDNLYSNQLNQSVDVGYRMYLSNMQMSDNSYGRSNSGSDLKANYYKMYLNTLVSAYSTYKLQLINQGCQPQQPAPAPQAG